MFLHIFNDMCLSLQYHKKEFQCPKVLCDSSILSPPPISESLLLLLSRFSRVRLCVNPWTAAYQVPLSMGFSRQEYWSGVGVPLASQGREEEELPEKEDGIRPFQTGEWW